MTMKPTVALDRAPPITTSQVTRFFPQGIASPILLTAMMAIAGLCIDRSDWALLSIPMVVVAIVATIYGCLVSRLIVDDAISHAISMVMASIVVGGMVGLSANELGEGLRARLRGLGRVVLDWYFGRPVPDETESYLVSLLMGLTVWLVGYLAAWSLFRRGWVYVAIALPAFLILVNLGSTEQSGSRWLAGYAILAVVLLARVNLWMREREWQRHGIAGPTGLAGRFLAIGMAVALLATSFAWQTPDGLSQRALQPVLENLTQRIESAQESMSGFVDRVSGTGEGATIEGGDFAAFSQAFSIGGPLELSDEPQVVVFADSAPYLTAQHYDTYSGRGWASTTEATFRAQGADGRRYAPEMTFAPNQPVPLSDQVVSERTNQSIDILPLVPTAGRMLTVDTYQASSVQSSVRMSWIQLDGVAFSVDEGSMSLAPRDVARLVQLLTVSDLSGPDGDAGPTATDAELNEAIDRERDQLAQRFLDVTWSAASGQLQAITVTGQIPVYDDVDSVYYRNSSDQETRYTVLARPSQATPDDLRSAGVDYPDWVVERYLQLPETVSARTLALVQEETSGLENPYDQARAIEEYLRSNIVYDETVSEPPAGADIVDYLLFERQRGYCEYSATAMTVMLRAIGIPARVAVGFYPGGFDQSVGGFMYLQSNAHAWTEVYFSGYGWIPFEPTSSQPLIDEGSGTGDPESEEQIPAPTEAPVEPTVPMEDASPAAANPDDQPLQAPVELSQDGNSWPGLAMPALAILGVVAAGAAAMWLAWTIPLRHLSPAGALYQRVRRIGGWLGIHPGASSTPEEFSRAFVERVPASRPDVERIVSAYEYDTYGPETSDRSQILSSAQDAWDAIRRRLPAWFVRRK